MTRRVWPYRLAVVLLILFLCLASAWAAWKLIPPKIVEAPPLPPEVVRVEVVKEIPVPGPERVVERVRWRTRDVPVPIETVREVVKVVERAAELGSLGARVEATGDRYEGVDADGDYRAGWAGSLACEVRAEAADAWTTLIREPFSVELSHAQTTIAPEPSRLRPRVEIRVGLGSAPSVDFGASWYRRGRRWGLWTQAAYSLDPGEVYRGQGEYWREGTWEVSAGVARRFGR